MPFVRELRLYDNNDEQRKILEVSQMKVKNPKKKKVTMIEEEPRSNSVTWRHRLFTSVKVSVSFFYDIELWSEMIYIKFFTYLHNGPLQGQHQLSRVSGVTWQPSNGFCYMHVIPLETVWPFDLVKLQRLWLLEMNCLPMRFLLLKRSI